MAADDSYLAGRILSTERSKQTNRKELGRQELGRFDFLRGIEYNQSPVRDINGLGKWKG